jgi:GNAT superfamily N-acetyltransferase
MFVDVLSSPRIELFLIYANRCIQLIDRTSPFRLITSTLPSPNMPLVLRPMNANDTLSWTRIRTLAYHGPLHILTHKRPISESSILAVAEDRKKEIGKPNTWQWKVVDTDLPPSEDDGPDNDGRTIAFAIWSAHNLAGQREGSGSGDEGEGVDSGQGPQIAPFVPPELRLDMLTAVLNPLRAAQEEIMGSSIPYLKLDSLATHPEHCRRGAGKMLLVWGVGKADAEGWRTYLDATPVGLKSYERVGFRIEREVTFDREGWGGEGRDWWACMVREVGGK